MIEGNWDLFNWTDGKGYGFVRPDNQAKDVFVHGKDVEGVTALFVGSRVAMDVMDGRKGPRGVAATLIDK